MTKKRTATVNKKIISLYLSKKLFTDLAIIAYFRGLEPNSQFIESELGAMVSRVFAKGDYEERLQRLAEDKNTSREEIVKEIMRYLEIEEFYDEGIK